MDKEKQFIFEKGKQLRVTIGLDWAKRGHYERALRAFIGSMYMSNELFGFYSIEINPKITACIKEIAELYKQKVNLRVSKKNGKIRLGYLTEGFDSGQAPIDNLINLATYHDKDIFDITFYSKIREEDRAGGYQRYSETIEHLKHLGHSVTISPFMEEHIDRTLYLANEIVADNIDILCTYAMYTVPWFHVLCAMNLTPVLIKDVYQQPEFSDLPDLTIHYMPWSYQKDTGNKIYIPQRWPRPKVKKILTRSDFGIPNDATVLASVGRNEKFRGKTYWSCIETVIEQMPNTYFLGIGCELKNDNPRIKNIGFRDDVFDILQIVDIYLSTWPLSGGTTIAEAIFAKIPVVVFSHPEGKFDVNTTTLPEILNIPELTVQRWWMGNWVNLVKYLIKDKDFYNRMKEKVIARGKEIERYGDFVKEKEKAMLEVYNSKMEEKRNVNCQNSYNRS